MEQCLALLTLALPTKSCCYEVLATSRAAGLRTGVRSALLVLDWLGPSWYLLTLDNLLTCHYFVEPCMLSRNVGVAGAGMHLGGVTVFMHVAAQI